MTGTHNDDRALTQRLLAGDESAWRELFSRAFPALYRFALRRLDGDAAAAEEVAQATLCSAIDRLHTYRGEAALLTWLFTFCRHELAAYWGRRGGRPHQLELREDVPEIRAALEALANDDQPGAEAERREVGRRVRLVLDLLPAHYGRVLTWRYLQEHSVADVGRRLGISTKAAESLLARARAAFRDGFATLLATAADGSLVHAREP